jgi:bifunctional non-homologous end joining protein LigD
MATTKKAAKKASRTSATSKPADSSPSSSRAPQEVSSAADVVDEQLARYRSMRDFHVTAEPTGTGSSSPSSKGDPALPFCIQKHAASHLHYDFRLGWNGVLKSWACAKGPSYNVRDKRLAVQVEDHPIEYGGFEGIIPAGQYGGGTVMLWDQGTWEPQPGHTDVDAGLRNGQLKFIMHGTKMKGKWALIRMGGKAAQEKKPNWLLIKEHDEFERPEDAEAITEAESRSVVSGRSIEEIAKNEDHVWNSKETAQGNAWYRQDSPVAAADSTATAASRSPGATRQAGPARKSQAMKIWADELKNLPDELQPSFLKPQFALEASSPPEGDAWLHELKLDGYRIQARKQGSEVKMLTRSGLDWTHRIPAVAQAVSKLAPANITLDGEVVVLAENGTTNFADLQASFQEGAKNPLTYFCFDLLHVEGKNVRDLTLVARKKLLADLLSSGDGDTIRFSEHIGSGGEAVFQKACELHAEGIVSKKAAGRYIDGRSGDWLKSKCLHEQEFVIGGYSLPSDGSHGVGSLLLGYYRSGKLIYAGRTGTGFTQKMRRSLREKLEPLETNAVSFDHPPSEAKRGAIWVKPQLIAQVRFATWTAEDLVRQAAFLGLREDKAPEDVRREEATAPPKPKSSKAAKPAAKATRSKSAAAHRPGPSLVAAKTLEVAPVAAKTGSASQIPSAQAITAQPAIAHASIRLTHPDKVLDTESGVTKQMLADFYWAVADRMLPHIADRPLSLVRCPEGSNKPCFYQKHVNHMLPKGIHAVDVPDKKTGVPEPYITLNTPEALAGLAQMGVLEVHPWGSRNQDLEHADRLIFDLDPDEALGWNQVTAAALDVRQRLKEIGLESFLKTTGGKGLHIVVPVQATMEWPDVKEWARIFVLTMERADPSLYLTKMTKAARVGKIYLDYLRNERGATAVAPYSPRARSGMGVSLPLSWSELKQPLRPIFRVANFADWRDRLKTDPWKAMETTKQRIAPVA